MQWLLSLLGIKKAEPLEESEVVSQVARELKQFQNEVQGKSKSDDLCELFPEPIPIELMVKARHILDVVKKLRGPREVTAAARETIERLKAFTPKHEGAIYDVDEMVTKVKVVYTSPRGVVIELHSKSKSAASIDELLLATQEYLGRVLIV